MLAFVSVIEKICELLKIISSMPLKCVQNYFKSDKFAIFNVLI